jgi:hypothetical protein
MILRKSAPLAAAALFLSGCVARILDFTVISTKNVDIPGTRGAKVEGEDMKSIVIVVPTGQPDVKAAVDQALEKGDADLLLDGVIYMKQWYIPYIYGQMGFVVEGTAMHTSPAGAAPAKGIPVAVPASAAAASVPAPVTTSVAPAAALPTPAPPPAPVAAEQAAAAAPAASPAPNTDAAPRSKIASQPAPVDEADEASRLLP